MLKTLKSPNKLAPGQNNDNRSSISKNDNSKLASEKNNDNNEVNRFGVCKNTIKHAKKSGKLLKLGKLKSKKTSKF